MRAAVSATHRAVFLLLILCVSGEVLHPLAASSDRAEIKAAVKTQPVCLTQQREHGESPYCTESDNRELVQLCRPDRSDPFRLTLFAQAHTGNYTAVCGRSSQHAAGRVGNDVPLSTLQAQLVRLQV